MNFKSFILVAFLFPFSAFADGIYPGPEEGVDPKAPWLGILGDSGTTGAASDPRLQPNLGALTSLLAAWAGRSDAGDLQPPLEGHPLAGKLQKFEPPLRIYYRDDELQQKDGSGIEGGMKAALQLDIEENSFGYQYGIQKGIAPKDMVFVGQDGSRVAAIPKQLARFYGRPSATLPPVVLVSFNANDFCDEQVMTEDLGQRTQYFAADLATAWSQAVPLLKPHPQGTKFIVLSPIEVANVLTNEDLLSQQIDFEGQGGMTCKELRETNFRAKLDELNGEKDLIKQAQQLGDRAKLEAQVKVQEALVGMCPAVLGTKPGDKDRLARLQQIQSQFRQVWRDQIGLLNKEYEGKGLSWQFVESIADIKFTKGDASHECFHPSAAGAAKIAAELLKVQ